MRRRSAAEEAGLVKQYDFGLRLRQLRHDRRETLEQVSEATGLSVAMLSRVERGERLPSPDSVEALAKHFGLPVDDLMSETIANRMLNRYGPVSSRSAAERMASTPMEAASMDMWLRDAEAAAPARPSAPRSSLRAMRSPGPQLSSGAVFSRLPIEELFPSESERESLSDAAQVAEVAIHAAMRAVERAKASGDPTKVAEAEKVVERLRAALERKAR